MKDDRWKAMKRKDGSVLLTKGTPLRGAHQAFDVACDYDVAEHIASALNMKENDAPTFANLMKWASERGHGDERMVMHLSVLDCAAGSMQTIISCFNRNDMYTVQEDPAVPVDSPMRWENLLQRNFWARYVKPAFDYVIRSFPVAAPKNDK